MELRQGRRKKRREDDGGQVGKKARGWMELEIDSEMKWNGSRYRSRQQSKPEQARATVMVTEVVGNMNFTRKSRFN